MLNADIAYLLGMIVGKGEIKRGEKYTQVIINIPHKNLSIENENTQQSIKSSLLDIINRLQPLIGADLKTDTSNNQIATLYFSKDNEDFLIRSLNAYLKNNITWRTSRIPAEIFTTTTDTKKEFLRGLADVTGHIRGSNYYYDRLKSNRVYLEIMDNWDLTIDIANLLKTLNITVQTIRFAHPNIVDTHGNDYARGVRNYKEHQIKIWAEEFEKIGFNIEHKNRLLKKYADLNRNNWRGRNAIESRHRYYWNTRSQAKIKPNHPDENSPRIHLKIRGKHFNSWQEIARDLGYE